MYNNFIDQGDDGMKQQAVLKVNTGLPNKTGLSHVLAYVKKYWYIYLLALPGTIHMIIFQYVPIYGILMAFKDFNYRKGIIASPWAGLKHFTALTLDHGFLLSVRNTLLINLYSIVFGFTFIVLLALLINEINNMAYKKVVQTFVYLPHFLSWVVFAGLITTVLLSPSEGIINRIIIYFGGDPVFYMSKPEYFQFIVVAAGTIKEAGFATIIYLAAIAGVNPELYQSAIIDGAHRGHLMRHITLPQIMPSVAVLLILRLAALFQSNFEQIYTMYNPTVYDTGDVISTYMYRMGLLQGNLEQGTAMGLVFGIIGLVLIVASNKFIKKMDVMGIF